MQPELKIFLGMLIVVLLTLSSMADADDLPENNNHHLWIYVNGEKAPVAQMSMAYLLEDSRFLCSQLAQVLNEATPLDSTYLCVNNREHWNMILAKYGK